MRVLALTVFKQTMPTSQIPRRYFSKTLSASFALRIHSSQSGMIPQVFDSTKFVFIATSSSLLRGNICLREFRFRGTFDYVNADPAFRPRVENMGEETEDDRTLRGPSMISPVCIGLCRRLERISQNLGHKTFLSTNCCD